MLYSKYAPSLAIHFCPSVLQIVDAFLEKSFTFWGDPVSKPFFDIFVIVVDVLLGKCVRHRWKQVVVRRGQVWWVRRVGQEFATKCRNGVSDVFRCVWWGVVLLQNHFSVSCSPIWALLDQCKVQIDQLLTVANGIHCFTWYTTPFWSHLIHSIVFLPKRFGFAVDVDGCPGSTHDFLRFGFSK